MSSVFSTVSVPNWWAMKLGNTVEEFHVIISLICITFKFNFFVLGPGQRAERVLSDKPGMVRYTFFILFVRAGPTQQLPRQSDTVLGETNYPLSDYCRNSILRILACQWSPNMLSHCRVVACRNVNYVSQAQLSSLFYFFLLVFFTKDWQCRKLLYIWKKEV